MIGKTVADQFFHVLDRFRRMKVARGPAFETIQEFEPIGKRWFLKRNPLNVASFAARSFKE